MERVKELLWRNILVIQDESDTMLNGLEVPSEKLCTGIVYKVGKEVSEINVGDRVMFSKFGVSTDRQVELDGKELLRLHETSVEIILENQ